MVGSSIWVSRMRGDGRPSGALSFSAREDVRGNLGVGCNREYVKRDCTYLGMRGAGSAIAWGKKILK